MKVLFWLISLLSFQFSSFATSGKQITTCIGGFDGKRDLVLIVDNGFAATKSSKAILLNQKEWKKHDESELFSVFKKSGFKSFEDEYVLLIASKDGKHVSYHNAAKSSDGVFFEMEEFECSGF